MIGDRAVNYHEWRAWLLLPNGGNGAELPIERARFKLDEGWSPFGQGEITVAIDSVPELDELELEGDDFIRLEQRTIHGASRRVGDFSGKFPTVAEISAFMAGGTVATLSEFFRWGSFDGVSSEADDRLRVMSRLMVRSREYDLEAGTVTIGFATEDARLHDRWHASSTVPALYAPAGTNTVYKLANWVLAQTVGGDGIGRTGDHALTAPYNRDDNPWQNGDSAIDFLAPIVEAADLVLYCDVNGVWTLEQNVTPGGLYPLTGQLSSAATLVRARELIDLDRTVVQSVLVRYQWEDANGDRQTRYDAAQVPNGPTRNTHVVQYERAWPGAGAAARILKTLRARRRTVPVEAVSDYGVGPGMRLDVGTPYFQVRGVVRSVSWSIPSDRMTIETRDVVAIPDN